MSETKFNHDLDLFFEDVESLLERNLTAMEQLHGEAVGRRMEAYHDVTVYADGTCRYRYRKFDFHE